MEVLAIWIIITELPNIKMIVTFTKRVQNKYSQPLCNYGSVNSKLAYRIAARCRGGGGVGGVLDQYLGVGEPLRV